MSSEKEIWWKNLTTEPVIKRAGRRVDPATVAFNRTTIAFGANLVDIFKGAKSVHIERVLNRKGDLSGLIFNPLAEEDGYTIRAPTDRQTIQIVLPKPLRPIFDKRKLYGTYSAEVHEGAPGYADHTIIAVRLKPDV